MPIDGISHCGRAWAGNPQPVAASRTGNRLPKEPNRTGNRLRSRLRFEDFVKGECHISKSEYHFLILHFTRENDKIKVIFTFRKVIFTFLNVTFTFFWTIGCRSDSHSWEAVAGLRRGNRWPAQARPQWYPGVAKPLPPRLVCMRGWTGCPLGGVNKKKVNVTFKKVTIAFFFAYTFPDCGFTGL